ncbi:hypothetical protein RvY_01295 [Ramazzottius varieornatus]|uniref:Uncharacterized protein n=1 Tax=Ramazzottius varieornatus TaxID=947166 RepID=A0A1D1UR34_RAMVA|nr:hypothetical protein RvY_01295 [Ramazzottius varieornatus]
MLNIDLRSVPSHQVDRYVDTFLRQVRHTFEFERSTHPVDIILDFDVLFEALVLLLGQKLQFCPKVLQQFLLGSHLLVVLLQLRCDFFQAFVASLEKLQRLQLGHPIFVLHPSNRVPDFRERGRKE